MKRKIPFALGQSRKSKESTKDETASPWAVVVFESNNLVERLVPGDYRTLAPTEEDKTWARLQAALPP